MNKFSAWALFLAIPALTHAANSLRVSFAPTVTPACGPWVDSEDIRQAATGRLRAAGITVSTIHTAVLALDLTCVTVAPDAHRNTLAVDECLTFSEFVAAPSKQNRATLAPTWRQCQSYTCKRSNCEPVTASSNQLIDQFVGEIRERAAIPPVTTASASASVDIAYTRLVFFGAYILTCLTLLVYRGFRGFRGHISLG